MTTPETRRKPNILITGTPGCGKTSTANRVAEELGYQHVDVSALVTREALHESYDEEFQCWVVDEDACMYSTDIGEYRDLLLFERTSERMADVWRIERYLVLDRMEEMLKDGGFVVDYHCCELFPERWFDLVLVLRVETQVLYDRLVARYRYESWLVGWFISRSLAVMATHTHACMYRNYSSVKIKNNMECEIMQTILDEARDSYAHEIVVELPSNSLEDMASNIDRIVAWNTAWLARKNGSAPEQ